MTAISGKAFRGDWRCWDDVVDARLKARNSDGTYLPRASYPAYKAALMPITRPPLGVDVSLLTQSATIRLWKLRDTDDDPLPGYEIEFTATRDQWIIQSIQPAPRLAGYVDCLCGLAGATGANDEL